MYQFKKFIQRNANYGSLKRNDKILVKKQYISQKKILQSFSLFFYIDREIFWLLVGYFVSIILGLVASSLAKVA